MDSDSKPSSGSVAGDICDIARLPATLRHLVRIVTTSEMMKQLKSSGLVDHDPQCQHSVRGIPIEVDDEKCKFLASNCLAEYSVRSAGQLSDLIKSSGLSVIKCEDI